MIFAMVHHGNGTPQVELARISDKGRPDTKRPGGVAGVSRVGKGQFFVTFADKRDVRSEFAVASCRGWVRGGTAQVVGLYASGVSVCTTAPHGPEDLDFSLLVADNDEGEIL